MHLLKSLVPARFRKAYRRFRPLPGPDLLGAWQSYCQKWCLGYCEVTPDRFHISGWLAIEAIRRPHVGFRVNGRIPEETVFPYPQPEVAAQLPFAPGARESGFTLTGSQSLPGDIVVEAFDRRTGAPLGDDYRPLEFPAVERWGPMPDPQRTVRVVGSAAEFNFRYGGWMSFRSLSAAVEHSTGQSIEAFPRVLDWGCGCGRVARHFLNVSGLSVTGADVDADNIAWCRRNLPNGTWSELSLRPPSPFATACFDLLYGISVLTHLREDDQFRWLDELHRILRPGGLALLTFHGEASLPWSGITGERYAVLRRHGFCDQPNGLYDAALAEADYYRDTFHTDEYIRREWGRRFDVLAIRHCAIGNQDLAVLRKA